MVPKFNTAAGLTLLLAATMSSTGCLSHHQQMAGMSLSQPLQFEPLARSEYEILEAVEGSSCREHYALLPLPIFFSIGEPKSTMIPRVRGPGPAGGAALLNALETVEDADAVISPVWSVERTSALPWWSKTCVQVKARAVRLKTDGQ